MVDGEKGHAVNSSLKLIARRNWQKVPIFITTCQSKATEI